MTNQQSLTPRHIGFILDGNRRWARSEGLPTLEGHRKGYDNLISVAELVFGKGIVFMSAYIFSTENWDRAKEEVDYLMGLALKVANKDVRKLTEKNVRIVVFGVEERVPKKVREAFEKVEQDSKSNTGGTLALCFNYGGQREIVDAVKQIVDEGLPSAAITQETIRNHLYHPEVPEVDLLIRTSGEQRISNFMLWRIAYAELYFTKVHWPEFDAIELDKALQEYTKRNRRFGGN